MLRPRADGLVIAMVALSAEWPAWSKKQARAARMACAVCETADALARNES
ncbi:hypothetical protein ACFXA3_02945 [Streptomyces sp. NPDC059456]